MSLQWIKPLFESAASTRLDSHQGDEASAAASDAPEDLSRAEFDASRDRTVSDLGDESRMTEESADGTPRALRQPRPGDPDVAESPSEPQWSNDMSPFRPGEVDTSTNDDAAGAIAGDYSALRNNLPDAQRIRLRDLPPESPDTPHFETMTFRPSAHGGQPLTFNAADLHADSASSHEPSFATAVPDTPGSKRPAPLASGRGGHSALLDKVLRKGMDSPSLARASPARPGARTAGPSAQKSRLQLPGDIPKNWDGIADLSTRGLTAFPSPMKAPVSAARSGPGHASGRHLMSSPGVALLNASTSTVRRFPASPAPSIALSRTPAKEAARRIAQSVYDATGEFDSPDLPSGFKNASATKLFDFDALDREEADEPGADSPSQSRSMAGTSRAGGGPASAARGNDSYASVPSQPSFVQRSPTQLYNHHQHDTSAASSSAAAGPRGTLADFGGGTTANIDELLASASIRYDPADASNAGGSAAPGDFAGIVDDDDIPRGGESGPDPADDSFTGDAEPGYQRPADPTLTEYDAAYAQATGRGSLRLPGRDGPEDTLFGMPNAAGGGGTFAAAPSSSAAAAGKRPAYAAVEEEDDTFTDDQAQVAGGGGSRSGFRLHGLDDMATLHGGELLGSGELLLHESIQDLPSLLLMLSVLAQNRSKRVPSRKRVTSRCLPLSRVGRSFRPLPRCCIILRFQLMQLGPGCERCVELFGRGAATRRSRLEN